MNKIICGDSKEVLREIESESVDCVVTDPPYGYSFMGKSWDKTLPDIEIFKECLRVLKPGAFAFVMSAPRSDVCARMMLMLEDAGFEIGFTPIYWTYASGFPKAMNIGKMVDKRLGAERSRVPNPVGNLAPWRESEGRADIQSTIPDNKAITPEAKALEGSYGGFQPKPAVEVVIVAMKPLSEKTFVDQALKNGKGITWLDDCRVPYKSDDDEKSSIPGSLNSNQRNSSFGIGEGHIHRPAGRFPANLLVSDDVLNDGRVIPASFRKGDRGFRIGLPGEGRNKDGATNAGFTDTGSYSRYFSLDAWASKLPESVQKTFPFLIVPKAAKSEKNKGLDCIVSITIIDEWDKEAKPVQLQVVMDNSRLRATVVSGTQNKDVIAWSMSLFGSDFMNVPFLLNTKSTTLTEISSITPQIISSYLTGLLTSGRIANAYLKTESGGNLVQLAENSNTLESITNEETESATSASPVSSKERYAISVKDGSNIHSTVKPLQLMSYLITLGSREGDIILDPFVGSGTTCIAAKMLNRKYIGIEREKEYVEIAEARLKAVPDTLFTPTK